MDKIKSNMNELTIILFAAALAFYILTWFVKRPEPNWMAFFMSICAIGGILMDDTITETETVVMILPLFYAMVMSGLSSWGGVRRR